MEQPGLVGAVPVPFPRWDICPRTVVGAVLLTLCRAPRGPYLPSSLLFRAVALSPFMWSGERGTGSAGGHAGRGHRGRGQGQAGRGQGHPGGDPGGGDPHPCGSVTGRRPARAGCRGRSGRWTRPGTRACGPRTGSWRAPRASVRAPARPPSQSRAEPAPRRPIRGGHGLLKGPRWAVAWVTVGVVRGRRCGDRQTDRPEGTDSPEGTSLEGVWGWAAAVKGGPWPPLRPE